MKSALAVSVTSVSYCQSCLPPEHLSSAPFKLAIYMLIVAIISPWTLSSIFFFSVSRWQKIKGHCVMVSWLLQMWLAFGLLNDLFEALTERAGSRVKRADDSICRITFFFSMTRFHFLWPIFSFFLLTTRSHLNIFNTVMTRKVWLSLCHKSNTCIGFLHLLSEEKKYLGIFSETISPIDFPSHCYFTKHNWSHFVLPMISIEKDKREVMRHRYCYLRLRT